MGLAIQRSFEDLGTPLYDVTFCVIDFETTGGSPTEDMITEIGAVKLRGGECLGTLQTLVNPGRAIPPSVTIVTGITESMVWTAPRIETVLPTLLEFVGDAVIVAHNARFDLAFLALACERAGYPRRTNRSIDTVALARRLVRDEVPNCKLSTLATRFRLPHRPTHRALDDALATGDLLHILLERAAGLGVTGLDDLLALPTIGGHAQAGKLKLTTGLPRAPGVYLFRDQAGNVLYVGKATDLRSRVRSYFSTDDRRKTGRLFRETQRIDHQVCASPLEAAVREVRLIHRLQPRYNRQAKTWGRYAYLKLTLNEPFPRLSVVRDWRDDGGFYLGPLPSPAAARRVAEAIETVVPLRRCTQRIGPRTPARDAPCAPAQLGVATCPCAGAVTAEAYGLLVDRTVRALTQEPEVLLAPLRHRMQALAAAERFEEAADVRDRGAALTSALRRQRRIDALRRAGRLVVELDGQGGAALQHGRLLQAWGPGERAPRVDRLHADAMTGVIDIVTDGRLLFDGYHAGIPPGLSEHRGGAGRVEPAGGDDSRGAESETDGGRTVQLRLLGLLRPAGPPAAPPPCPRDLADEVLCVAAWIDAKADNLRMLHCDEGFSSPLPVLTSFEPRGSTGGTRS